METWVSPVLALLGGLAGGVFGSYFSKRGEIRGIHRELDRVIEQNTAITAATEEIKAKISNEQREWQFKKEIVKELCLQLPTLQKHSTQVILHMEESTTLAFEDDRLAVIRKADAAMMSFILALEPFTSVLMLMQLAFDRTIVDATSQILGDIQAVTALSRKGDANLDVIRKKIKGIGASIQTLLTLLKSDLHSSFPELGKR